jgi:plasmid stabilization system protein ParE
MAREVGWAESASDDLAEIASYIAKDSEFSAAAVVRELIEAARSLDVFAQRGRMVPEYRPPCGSYWSRITGSCIRLPRLRFMCFVSFTEHEGFQRSRLRLADFWARVQGCQPRFGFLFAVSLVGLQSLGKDERV